MTKERDITRRMHYYLTDVDDAWWSKWFARNADDNALLESGSIFVVPKS